MKEKRTRVISFKATEQERDALSKIAQKQRISIRQLCIEGAFSYDKMINERKISVAKATAQMFQESYDSDTNA